MVSESAIQLNYAKRPGWHRRRAFRWLVVGIALIAVAGSAWRWGPEKWEQAQLLYCQWRCMNYSPRANRIVFDQDPTGKSALLNDHRVYVPIIKPGYEGPAITVAAAIAPDCAYRFFNLARGFARMPIANLGSPIIFMHERFSPSGKRYLVVLHGMNGEDASLMACPVGQIGVNVDLWEPAALDVPPKSANYLGDPFGTRLLDGSIVKRLRVFAGQADPNDPTHFVIRFEEDGQPGIIDGYVCDGNVANGSSVYGDSVAHVKLIERPAN